MYFGEAVSSAGTGVEVRELPAGCVRLHVARVSLEAAAANARAALYVKTAIMSSAGSMACRLHNAAPAGEDAAVSLSFDKSQFPLKFWCKPEGSTKGACVIHLTGTFEHSSSAEMHNKGDAMLTSLKRKDIDKDPLASTLASIPAPDMTSKKKKNKSDSNHEAPSVIGAASSSSKSQAGISTASNAIMTAPSPSEETNTRGSSPTTKLRSVVLSSKVNLDHWPIKKHMTTNGVAVKKLKKLMIRNNVFIVDHVLGSGPEPKLGAEIGLVYEAILPDGTVFDRTEDPSHPLKFRKGTGQVIRGLDIGLEGLRLGGWREITVPPALG
jgi:FKBP-type peptidyl-prolyl cis-trans isomerase